MDPTTLKVLGGPGTVSLRPAVKNVFASSKVQIFVFPDRNCSSPSSQAAAITVGEDMGQQGWDRVLVMGVLASVQVQVQCGGGRRIQVVWRQEYPPGLSQQLQTDG